MKVIYGDNEGSQKEMRRMARASDHDSILKLLGTVPPCTLLIIVLINYEIIMSCCVIMIITNYISIISFVFLTHR